MAIDTPANFLADHVRKELADEVTPYLWSDDELYLYMNEAQREFAIETKCIPDSYTYQGIPFTVNDGWIPLDEEIIDIMRVITVTGERELIIKTLEEFSADYWEDDYGYRKRGRWEDQTGDPTHLLTNLEANEARLYPIPNSADTFDMYVWREPFHTLSSTSTGFEIPKRYVYRLIYKIKSLAYSKQDYETFDGDKRAENKFLWGEAILDAQSKVKKRARKPRPVRYGGIV